MKKNSDPLKKIAAGVGLLGIGMAVANRKFMLKQEDYDKACLKMATLDEEICSKNKGITDIKEKEDNIHEKYLYYKQANRGKTRELIEKRIAEMEEKLKCLNTEA